MNPNRIVESFFEMARIASPSFHEAPMAAYCADKLRELGFSVRIDDAAQQVGSDTGNVIAYLPGTTGGHIAFSSHMDTVTPCEGIEPVIVEEELDGETCEVIRSAGDTILSSDDKAGIAAIFEALRCVIEEGRPHPAITVVLTICEEQGLLGASAVAPDAFVWEGGEEASPEASVTAAGETAEGTAESGEGATRGAAAALSIDEAIECREGTGEAAMELVESAVPGDSESAAVPCFVLDADGAPGTIITGAPFHYVVNVTFHGRAAHAGVEPEAGISAIQMAAAAIADMPLGRLDERTTANIGLVSGGSATNVVAAECKLEGECRSLYEDRVEAQRAAMTQAMEQAAGRFGGTVDISWKLDYPAILLSEESEIVIKLKAAARAAGLEPRTAITGGGADANVLGTKGADAVTLGIGMTNFHTCDEYVKVRDLQDSARFVEAIIAEYARE